MNCSRCQAELSDSATVCTACGTPTRISYSIPATFSYLPAGAPPWPTSVPENLPYSNIRTTGSVVETSASATKTKSNVTARSILIAVAILVLVPLLGAAITLTSLYANGQLKGTSSTQTVILPTRAAATPGSTTNTPAANGTPVATNQLPTASSFKKSNGATNLGIALKYPTNWAEDALQTSTSVDYVRWHPQQSQYGILFIIQRFSTSTSTSITSANDLNQQLIQSINGAQGVHSLQMLQTTHPQLTIGGTTWTEQDAGYLSDNGIQIRFTAISVQHNKMYYNIVLISPDIYYSEAMQKYIQPMFDSLQFLT